MVHEAISSLKFTIAGTCTDLLLIVQKSKDLSSSDQDGSGRWAFWLQTIGLRKAFQKP